MRAEDQTGVRAQEMLLTGQKGTCLAPGHERTRKEDRKWARDTARAR